MTSTEFARHIVDEFIDDGELYPGRCYIDVPEHEGQFTIAISTAYNEFGYTDIRLVAIVISYLVEYGITNPAELERRFKEN